MVPFNYIIRLFAVFGILCLTGCDGGTLTAGGGIGGTGVTSSGSVSSIGSVWVNGVRYDTQDADIYIVGQYQGSGDQAVIANLNVGHVVQVEGDVDAQGNGTAESVSYTPLLVGPIEAIVIIDAYDATLSLLGQTVIVSDHTVWSGVGLNALVTGNMVEISGFIDDLGRIHATFVQRLADIHSDGDTLRITGQISNLDTVAQQFTINAQTVQYDQADLSAMAPGGLTNSIFVYITAQRIGGETDVTADTVAPFKRIGESDGRQVALEGLVSPGTGSHTYSIAGYDLDTDQSIAYDGGTEEDLIAGVRIEVEGWLDQGVLVADTITFNQAFRAESDLLDKDAVSGSIELAGMDALSILTNDLTRFSGLVASFDDLANGNHLKIKGMIVDDQTVLVRQVIALPEVQDKVTLRGTLLSVEDPEVSVNGVVIDTDDILDDGFFQDDDVPMTRADFFDAIQVDDWVHARGTLLPGDLVQWTSISLFVEE